jgi:FKBP-type peptidyl-prolyl cis-trans isomerase
LAKLHERAFALTAAILFFATTVAFSGVVVWQMHQDSKQNEATADINKQIQDQLKQQTNQTQEGKLQGTKLPDFTPVSSVTELQSIDLKEGNGDIVKEGATVTAHYTGALAKDGTIFESSKDSGQPATFPLSGVIQGWQKGVPGMKAGGIRRLIIPASMAYGEQGSPPKIGPNEPLVFDIELVSVQNP